MADTQGKSVEFADLNIESIPSKNDPKSVRLPPDITKSNEDLTSETEKTFGNRLNCRKCNRCSRKYFPIRKDGFRAMMVCLAGTLAYAVVWGTNGSFPVLYVALETELKKESTDLVAFRYGNLNL